VEEAESASPVSKVEEGESEEAMAEYSKSVAIAAAIVNNGGVEESLV